MKKHRGMRAVPPVPMTPLVVQRAEEGLETEAVEQGVMLEAMMEIFGRAARLANMMVHEPASAPAAFLRMVARWRELNLGEGATDAEAAAAVVAKANAHHLDGTWLETMPEDVRAYLAARWDAVRESFG